MAIRMINICTLEDLRLKLDDVVNLIPARIGGCLMVVAAGIAQLAEMCMGRNKDFPTTAWAMHGRYLKGTE